MQPFTTHTGIAVPLIKDDINTDQIAPVQSMRSLKPDYKALLFMRARRRDDGSEDPDFVLNQPQFRDPGILVTGHNFGAGSSREAAVWGMLANNIRVIVARSFADIYRENCLQNGLLPIVLEPRDAAAFADRVVAVNGAAPAPAAPMSASISRPPTACACSKASTTSGSPSSTPTRSRAGNSARPPGNPGCRPRSTAGFDFGARHERQEEAQSDHGRKAPRVDAGRL
jgi:3-isopropylmalate dehydratase small subunit